MPVLTLGGRRDLGGQLHRARGLCALCSGVWSGGLVRGYIGVHEGSCGACYTATGAPTAVATAPCPPITAPGEHLDSVVVRRNDGGFGALLRRGWADM